MEKHANPTASDDRAAVDVITFCRQHGICKATYFNLRRRGEGPREIRVGRVVRISAQAAADWRREREAANQQPSVRV